MRRSSGWVLAFVLAACTNAEGGTPPPGAVPTKTAPPPVAAAALPSPELPPSPAVYPWGPSAVATDRLDARFPTPAGFARIATTPESFGQFLRTLPLQPDGAPVVDFRGRPLHDRGHHPHIVAVADLDVGTKDLQHCADAILRLHAEWRYGQGQRDLSYRTVSGQTLSYRGYVGGDRAVADGMRIAIVRTAAPAKDDHALLRRWLDDVFSWAGTASLERDGKKVGAIAEVRPGDFFVMSGAPYGHAVLVLDVAKDDQGRAALLLGQSYMPAQSFQILRPARATGSAWFVVEPGDQLVDTPFWKPFPIASLRRL